MSKIDFPISEFEERQEKTRCAMEAEGLDLLLVISPININWLIGCRAKGYQEYQVLFFPRDPGPLTMLTRLCEVPMVSDQSLAQDVRGWGGREPEDPIMATKNILCEKRWLNQRIGLEVPPFWLSAQHYLGLRDVLGDALVAEPNELIENLKLAKSPTELEYIRRTAEMADAGMRTAEATLAPGKTQYEIAAEIHRTTMAMGSEIPASPMNFLSGDESCYAHDMPSDRILKSGDFIHIQFGTAYRRYHTTIGRQFSIGDPGQRAMQIFGIVREACDAAIAELRPGVSTTAAHRAAKRIIADAGLDRWRSHSSGYGIAPGFPPYWGDSVNLVDDDKHILEAGMVLAVEPPIFSHEERIGCRIVDNVLITETGAELLSKFRRELVAI